MQIGGLGAEILAFKVKECFFWDTLQRGSESTSETNFNRNQSILQAEVTAASTKSNKEENKD